MVVVKKEEQCASPLVGSRDHGGQCNVNSGQELVNDERRGETLFMVRWLKDHKSSLLCLRLQMIMGTLVLIISINVSFLEQFSQIDTEM